MISGWIRYFGHLVTNLDRLKVTAYLNIVADHVNPVNLLLMAALGRIRCPKAQTVLKWLLQHGREFTVLKWSPQSPDHDSTGHGTIDGKSVEFIPVFKLC